MPHHPYEPCNYPIRTTRCRLPNYHTGNHSPDPIPAPPPPSLHSFHESLAELTYLAVANCQDDNARLRADLLKERLRACASLFRIADPGTPVDLKDHSPHAKDASFTTTWSNSPTTPFVPSPDQQVRVTELHPHYPNPSLRIGDIVTSTYGTRLTPGDDDTWLILYFVQPEGSFKQSCCLCRVEPAPVQEASTPGTTITQESTQNRTAESTQEQMSLSPNGSQIPASVPESDAPLNRANAATDQRARRPYVAPTVRVLVPETLINVGAGATVHVHLSGPDVRGVESSISPEQKVNR